MLCDECNNVLSEYIDGTLELGEQSKVEFHIEQCSDCRSVRDDLLQIVQFSRSLPLHTPSNNIWDRVNDEIAKNRKPGIASAASRTLSSFQSSFLRFGPQWLTAAAAFAFVLILVVTLQLGRGTSTSVVNTQKATAATNASTAGVPFTEGSASANPDDVRLSIDDMEKRINTLDNLVEQKSASWAPDVKTAFNRDISYVDETLAQCHHELHDNPHDDVCREMMLNAYREKVRLLEGFTDY